MASRRPLPPRWQDEDAGRMEARQAILLLLDEIRECSVAKMEVELSVNIGHCLQLHKR
jgi:hypothetical protein